MATITFMDANNNIWGKQRKKIYFSITGPLSVRYDNDWRGVSDLLYTMFDLKQIKFYAEPGFLIEKCTRTFYCYSPKKLENIKDFCKQTSLSIEVHSPEPTTMWWAAIRFTNTP